MLRRLWLAIIGSLLAIPLLALMFFGGGALDILWLLAWVALVLGAFVRFGFLFVVVAGSANYLFYYLPATNDFSAWHSTGTISAVLVVLGLGLYGLSTSLADRSLFGDATRETGPRT